MLSNTRFVVAATALAPLLWGTTYITSTTLLVPGHPLFTATVRALPAGLVLLAIGRRMPQGSWWWRAAVLGGLNIAGFFAFLFIAADRLPGGVAAVVGGVQPLLVAALASRMLFERLTDRVVAAGIGGVVGVALIVLRSAGGLDAIGIAAALLGAVSMALGVVLAKKWSSDLPPLVVTAWQLVAGGVILACLTAVVEPLPTEAFTLTNVIGYAYLTLIGTALAYVLWFRGVTRLPTRIPAFLGLLSPVVALALGGFVSHEFLTLTQAAGVAVVFLSVVTVIGGPISERARSAKPGQPTGRTGG
ncbi:EamA family transporter [Microbacterium oleivorans]|uniref:Putative permease n=1 Tax=Microbacterium oleivorans TaxID=273677 RepID=A0A031FU18_9MICO|nr:EamA family transporter [Microbacterium oleivorans]EZP28093.1 putative permease [Microbacterium oleivorans]